MYHYNCIPGPCDVNKIKTSNRPLSIEASMLTGSYAKSLCMQDLRYPLDDERLLFRAIDA